MNVLKSYKQALARQPKKVRDEFLKNKNRMVLIVEGKQLEAGTDWKCVSPWNEVGPSIVTNPDGTPAYDRPYMRERPFIQVIAWGVDTDGDTRIAMIEQKRPHADEPEKHDIDGHESVTFFHCIAGTCEKTENGYETFGEAALREAREEAGISDSLKTEVVPYGHNQSPSSAPTWGGVAFIKVNLENVRVPEYSFEEPIEGVYWVKAHELLEIIKSGRTSRGAYVNVCTSNSAILLFGAYHPECFKKYFA